MHSGEADKFMPHLLSPIRRRRVSSSRRRETSIGMNSRRCKAYPWSVMSVLAARLLPGALRNDVSLSLRNSDVSFVMHDLNSSGTDARGTDDAGVHWIRVVGNSARPYQPHVNRYVRWQARLRRHMHPWCQKKKKVQPLFERTSSFCSEPGVCDPIISLSSRTSHTS
jgi:hypothetical protein